MNELEDYDIALQCEYCGEWDASDCVYEGRNLCPDCESVWYELDDMEATELDASIYTQ